MPRANLALAATTTMCALAILLGPLSVHAGTGGITSVSSAAAGPSRVTLNIDTYWVDGPGYRPVRVQATASQAATYDRTISVEFRADADYSRLFDIVVQQEFVLPAGATSGSMTIAVPSYQPWVRVAWDIWIDGEHMPEMSTDGTTGPAGDRSTWHFRSPRVLSIEHGKRGPDPTAIRMSPAQLPQRWIDFTCLDIIYLNAELLPDLVQNYPEAWQGIRRWCSSGGNLFVHNLGPLRGGSRKRKPGADLEALEKALEINKAHAKNWQATPERGGELFAVGSAIRFDYEKDLLYDPRRNAYLGGHLWRPHRLGSIVVFVEPLDIRLSSEDAAQGIDATLKWEAIKAERQIWKLRHGLSPDTASIDFYNFLVPGVGLAPVKAFWLMISLFVVVIGPLNYVLLRRARRLYLLVTTVPLCAMLFTGGLFLYAFLADGLGTKVRVRSYTEIDQRSGEAVCWARNSYYSGLAPGGGMHFGGDSIVLPILQKSRGDPDDREGTTRNIEWGDGQQKLRQGWLAARTSTQYLTVRARKTPRKLVFSQRDGQFTVENQLGTAIHHLLVTRDGQWFASKLPIESGERARLRALTKVELGNFERPLRQLFLRNWPVEPPELGIGEKPFGVSRVPATADWTAAPGRQSVLSRLEDALVLDRLKKRLGKRDYFAVVERSPEVQLGVDWATETNGFHVVVGHWELETQP